jgi:hypothetical protein
MVDLCRPSNLLGNNKKDGNSKYYPSVFVSSDWKEKRM